MGEHRCEGLSASHIEFTARGRRLELHLSADQPCQAGIIYSRAARFILKTRMHGLQNHGRCQMLGLSYHCINSFVATVALRRVDPSPNGCSQNTIAVRSKLDARGGGDRQGSGQVLLGMRIAGLAKEARWGPLAAQEFGPKCGMYLFDVTNNIGALQNWIRKLLSCEEAI